MVCGAGFAGLELSSILSEKLRDDVRVTLIDKNDSFFFGFSKLDVLVGKRTSDQIRMYYRDIHKRGVEFRHEPEFDGTEQTVVRLVPVEQIPTLIAEGKITHSLVVVGFHWLGLYEKQSA